MHEKICESLIEQAQLGDHLAREQIIEQGKPFIAKVSSTICKRYLCWGRDEELSVALLAYNEAIDAYNKDNKTTFTTFAHRVIHRRLVDYFRKEVKQQHLSLVPIDEDNNEFSKAEKDISIIKYQDSTQQEDLVATIATFNMILKDYGITFKNLVKCSPKHRDTRENLMRIALYIAENNELFTQLKKTKRLPVHELCKKLGVSRKVIEKGRKYIIALTLILTEPELTALKNFTSFPNTI
ncbi:RNA polymerase sigma-I factor [Desulfoscipio geothermicus]|uniref:RNA polymerase sigma factor SigI n=1 Tax=Desulfoscipio geothermicus DSM 3669 TaxID=1121426 RepID=A0A1I6D1A2_9FIRM|nr:RNA polymerase sigma-I factor [Desulfoscipio geothermicus]SFQ99093.1 RNA polymerase sigma factor [Desulfoscipio geothermicus DSM 3669]